MRSQKYMFWIFHYLVYADKEERIKGGGCLELRKFVEKELGLDPDSITGDWDFSHKLQLIWGDTLKKNPWIFNTIKQYFATMKSMNIGKSATQFFETAAELDNIVLSNKTYQETRFVRSLLRGITAALRNLPTSIAVVAKEYN